MRFILAGREGKAKHARQKRSIVTAASASRHGVGRGRLCMPGQLPNARARRKVVVGPRFAASWCCLARLFEAAINMFGQAISLRYNF